MSASHPVIGVCEGAAGGHSCGLLVLICVTLKQQGPQAALVLLLAA